MTASSSPTDFVPAGWPRRQHSLPLGEPVQPTTPPVGGGRRRIVLADFTDPDEPPPPPEPVISAPPRTRRLRRVLVLALALVVLGPSTAKLVEASYRKLTSPPFAVAAAGDVPSDFEEYIIRPTGEQADPVNLIFRAADAETVAAAVQRALGWPALAGSPMLFRAGGVERPTARHFGVSLGNGARYHIRIAEAGAADGQGYVLAAVHRDASVECGHVGVDFDPSRDFVGRAFQAAGYRVTSYDLDNTAALTHCDGTRNAGDGGALIIDLDGRAP